MKEDSLSNYFKGIAFKEISDVEVKSEKSNQHEFNGSNHLKKILGDKKIERIVGKLLWFDTDIDKNHSEELLFTWYDARKNHPTRSEFRLYYSNSEYISNANPGDLLLLALKNNNELLLIIAKKGSSAENQLRWLFAIDEINSNKFTTSIIDSKDQYKLNLAKAYLLPDLGIETQNHDDYYLEILLSHFGENFPTTSIFSKFAREHLKEEIDSINSPDITILKWMEAEEIFFKTFERYFLKKKMKELCQSQMDTDLFITYSLSVHNRRKSRSGHALENHVEEIFKANQIKYNKNGYTENKSKPDFIFPSIQEYHNKKFPNHLLHMLGVKTTCKDRWRQVLSEAQKITNKHLLTLEPGISLNQTNEMLNKNLSLVIPEPIHESYHIEQRKNLLTLAEFIHKVK